MDNIVNLVKLFLKYSGIFRAVKPRNKEEEEIISKSITYLLFPFILILIVIFIL